MNGRGQAVKGRGQAEEGRGKDLLDGGGHRAAVAVVDEKLLGLGTARQGSASVTKAVKHKSVLAAKAVEHKANAVSYRVVVTDCGVLSLVRVRQDLQPDGARTGRAGAVEVQLQAGALHRGGAVTVRIAGAQLERAGLAQRRSDLRDGVKGDAALAVELDVARDEVQLRLAGAHAC